MGGLDRTMSARIRMSPFGSVSAVSIIWSAQTSAIPRSVTPLATRTATRRRFSIKASRSMIGIAHNSPSVRSETSW